MGNSTAYFSQIIMHGLEKYALYCQKYPIALAWVHFLKYIEFNSKPAIFFLNNKKSNELGLVNPHFFT